MDPGRIAVRALAAYIYLLMMTRSSGKSVISQSTPFDFIVALIVGDLIDDALWAEVSIPKFGSAVLSVFLCDVTAKYAAFHSNFAFHLINGKSRAILRDGHEDGHELRAEKLNEDDLAHLLRVEGIDRDRWDDVHIALVERDHETSVILRPGAEPATKQLAVRVMEMVQKR